MKTFVLSLLGCFASLLCNAQTPVLDWIDGVTGANKVDLVEGNSAVSDAAGNIYITGNFTGSVDFDPGPGTWFHMVPYSRESIFILKVDAAGNMVWVRFLDGTGVGYHSAIAVDAAGNAFVTGQFSHTFDLDPGPGTDSVTSSSIYSMFLLRLDAGGNFVFAKALQSDSTDRIAGTSITVDANDSIYISGTFSGPVDFDPGPSSFIMTGSASQNMFISKFDPAGNFIWAKEVLTPGYISGNSITLDPTGNMLITGNFNGNVDFDPGSGTFMIGSPTSNSLFLLKLDNAGNFIWMKGITCSGNAYCIRTDAAGNVYSTGYYLGSADFDPGPGTMTLSGSYMMAYVLKLDAGGNFVRVLNFPGGGSTGTAITFNAAGDFFATGSFTGTVDFDPGPGTYARTATATAYDMFCLKFNAGSGGLDWVVTTEGSYNTQGFSIATNAGAAYTCGTFRGTTDFDPGPAVASLTSAGAGNIFLQKVHPDVSNDIGENTGKNSIGLYPNPAYSSVTLTNIPKAATITVCDITGRVLLTQKNEGASVQLDLQQQAAGIYFVNIVANDERVTKKIVKQ